MDLGNSIRSSGKTKVIIQSIIWNTIIEIFKLKKNIDITYYLVSIKLKGENILVKTNKPIINTELYNYSEEIKKISADKIKKLGLNYRDFEIKFL
ncbi:MAG: hypothetical protein Q9M94_07230 [Candidatus Gracilibacteria bacterium]|nr:hypothetical protein [Candidatus Gracilibacteria bacterium]MDQ7022224.1 hypothetical protein [Candidatus Gracilibacteria bacterium]